ncbi:MAG TPA: uracil-DNA glycosylase, partial [Eubacteriaceae bacterium]|nr:uracil-DNA glycosylase [Eubacteriaceae bacterium]
SLRNIYKELKEDLGCPIPNHGYLKKWADEGVLLLNAVLTVRAGQAASHKKIGWELFTDRIIDLLNQKQEPVVFLLWGNFAQSKAPLITNPHHLILRSPHPSPLSANRGFFGSRPFSKTNHFLKQHDIKPIDWCIDCR